MREEITNRVWQAIRERVFPGCVIGIVGAGGTREILPFGRFTYEEDAPVVGGHTLYDVASITKSIPTASLILTLIGEGRIRQTDRVRTYLPELLNDRDATVEDLLTYRVHGPRFSALADKTPKEFTQYILGHGFDAPPGESAYSNLPAFLLGLIAEAIAGKPLDEAALDIFFNPLGMSDTDWFPADSARIPPTEVVDGHEIRGIVHDESARVFARAHRAVGHAGLFSTAPDLLAFLEALLAGALPHVLYGAQRGWGWQRAGNLFMGEHCSEGSFGKTGFTGTSVAVDPEKHVALVILSNRTYPTRPPEGIQVTSAINAFRADIADIVLA